MMIPLSSNKSIQQLPLITKKSGQICSPLIEKMKTLHATNIRTIKKQQTQSLNNLQNYFNNKTQYLQTVFVKKQQNAQKVLKNLQNKSALLQKQNSQKSKKHNQLFKNYMSLSKEKIKANYLRQKAKLQSASVRKQEIDHSRYKETLIIKPNYRKIFLQELGKSQELHKTTIQKLLQAEHRRNQLKKQKQNETKGKLDKSIIFAQTFVNQRQSERKQKIMQKSIQKMRKSQTLINILSQKNRSASETSRKSMDQKFTKAQHKRDAKQKETIEKLEKILQQKCQKIETINERKNRNLETLAENLKRSRLKHMQQASQRSRSLMLETELRKSSIIHDNHEKWKFLTGIKNEFQKVKNENLYDSQQVSLRC